VRDGVIEVFMARAGGADAKPSSCVRLVRDYVPPDLEDSEGPEGEEEGGDDDGDGEGEGGDGGGGGMAVEAGVAQQALDVICEVRAGGEAAGRFLLVLAPRRHALWGLGGRRPGFGLPPVFFPQFHATQSSHQDRAPSPVPEQAGEAGMLVPDIARRLGLHAKALNHVNADLVKRFALNVSGQGGRVGFGGRA
jgi:hypothetical protein